MDRRLMLERATENIAAWNRHDADGVMAYGVEDLILRDIALPMPLHGRAAVLEATRQYMEALPDMRVEITSVTVEGARLVQEWTAEGLHRGQLLGLAPTGRAIRAFGATVLTFDDDARVIEAAIYWNPLAVLQQLGFAAASEEPAPA